MPRQPAARDAAASGVVASKLMPPGRTAGQVQRDAMYQRVLAAGSAKLVLVRAPAGFGKTTAMVQVREQMAAQGIDTAWLTLERSDNDVPRFLACLHQAVVQIVVDAPASPAPLDLMAALARHGAPFALFLDDFELISEPGVQSLVRELIDHLPRGGQLVLGSRSLPDLGLGRLRAAGQLLEVDTEALRFSLAETQRFFALRQGPLPPAAAMVPGHLAELHRKTEGWIAALWLASMALDAVIARQGSVPEFIAEFSGSNRAVADFLAEDVLARQTPEIRNFLLRTSVLRQFNAPLCQALSPRSDSRRILAQLDTANLFITPLSDAQGGAEPEWRYHSLFADFLRAQLGRERPDELARLHLAASGWYESQARPVPAIDHAIEGGDAPHALHLLSQHALDFLAQGRMRLLARWFAALPATLLQDHPMLQVVSLWATTLTRGPWLAMAQLQSSGCATSPDPTVLAHLHALKTMMLAMMDDAEQAHAYGREHLAQVPSGQAFADSVRCNAMAHVHGVLGERAQAERLLDAARSGQSGPGFNRMYSESVEGLLDWQQGRLRQATARFRLAAGMATGHAAPQGYQPTHGNAWAGVLYAATVYEANDLPQAEHLLNVYLPLARDVGLPDHMIMSHAMRSRIAFSRGDIDSALQTITELEYLGHHRQLPRVVASARLERARVLMLQGQAEAAEQALARADDPAVWQRVARHQISAHDVDDLPIGRLRWQVLFGDAAAAAQSAAAAAAQAQTALRQRRALKLQLLQALAQQRAGDGTGAVTTLMQCLPQAQTEGFVRLLLDEGPDMLRLLRRAQRALHEPGAGRIDPLLDDYLQRWAPAAGEALDADDETDTTPLPATAQPLDEPLTRKEIRVLQLLAEGYSNSAMAEKLFVSDSTVRTHLRNINMKLGARSRTQAVAIARRSGVIG
jgi:LuxR family maltose regulon positive regulatory protein